MFWKQRKVKPKSAREIELMREGGKRLAQALAEVRAAVRPGITGGELNEIAERAIRRLGGKPSFKGYRDGHASPFPAALCVSLNEVVVHGMPGERELREGDLVGLDLGMRWKGLFTDMAITVAVGKIDATARKLLAVTQGALNAALGVLQAGATTGTLGAAIEGYVKKHTPEFGVVRELVGHGVGYDVHEPPPVPNFGVPGDGLPLVEGVTLAIEPMVAAETPVILSPCGDGWGVRTRSGARTAHFEHTVVVTRAGCEILTQLA
jgi:methionyl aminopeptidase